MEIGSFSVFVAFRCALFYTTFSSLLFFFQNTSVNAQPLSPPFFEEIAAHKKYLFVSHVRVCVCVIFYFFIFLLISGYPLPTPWARLAPFWIDLGAICGPTFPRFPPPALNSCRDFKGNFARNFARNLQRTCRELARNWQETCKELPEN